MNDSFVIGFEKTAGFSSKTVSKAIANRIKKTNQFRTRSNFSHPKAGEISKNIKKSVKQRTSTLKVNDASAKDIVHRREVAKAQTTYPKKKKFNSQNSPFGVNEKTSIGKKYKRKVKEQKAANTAEDRYHKTWSKEDLRSKYEKTPQKILGGKSKAQGLEKTTKRGKKAVVTQKKKGITFKKNLKRNLGK